MLILINCIIIYYNIYIIQIKLAVIYLMDKTFSEYRLLLPIKDLPMRHIDYCLWCLFLLWGLDKTRK